ncbi:MAG: hypothetical protein V4654_15585 [Bdellovibrionota bacterium]
MLKKMSIGIIQFCFFTISATGFSNDKVIAVQQAQISELKQQVVQLQKSANTAAANAVCYSALASTSNHSVILLPLPNNKTNLDDECHKVINGGWHAGGVAKSRYFTQNCETTVSNELYIGGYTSFVTEAYFEGNPNLFTDCNTTNAYICCSPEFPN